MIAIVVIVLVVLIVAISLVTSWGGSSSSLIDGLFEFFEDLLAGKQLPNNGELNP